MKLSQKGKIKYKTKRDMKETVTCSVTADIKPHY